MKRLLTTALLVMCSISFSQKTNSLWKLTSTNSAPKSINKANLPLKHLFDLDFHSLKSKLASSPKRNASKNISNTVISLPNSEGKMENFRVYENSVMAPELAEKYPEIKSYIAIGIDNPNARAYFSSSPLGFKSMTLYPDQSAVFIEPVTADLNTYTIYKKSDKEASLDTFECSVVDNAVNKIQNKTNSRIAYRGADDGKLRTFRLALSCTAEYAAYFGGTKAGALAGMNNTLTRINGVFEKDFGVQLILIANNDTVIYTNPTTDPYSDYTSSTNWRSELKTNLNTTIGLANYDIGHLFGMSGINASGGDAGCIGCVCSDFNKGAGYTCANPISFGGDSFDIDFVAHEMGHQLGASHTFTHATETGTGAQMEPGSGSTIMSYSGSTTKDVQVNSDAYFHAISIQQVTDNIKNKTCAVLVATGNNVPVVNAGLNYSIPKGTPFMLAGSATDANTDDVLTYSWEQMDLGNATATVPNTTAITGPLFRSYSSSTSAVRYFPNMNTILAGSTTTSGFEIPVEVLPGVSRTLNFRLTVRDNRDSGSANNSDDMVITVDGNSGPFTVDSQNSAASFAAGTTQTINWTVAGTNAYGVNCATVDILLSTDGGKTFAITLLSGTPNTGSAQVVIPNIPGTTNRIMVKGTNQIFFDVNNVSFTISGSGATDNTAPTASTLSASGTTTSVTNLSWTAATDNIGVSGYNVYQNGVMKTTITATSLAVSGLTASTAYNFYIVSKDAAGNLSAASNTVNVTTLSPVDTSSPSASTLSASGITTSSTDLTWTAATDNIGVSGYNVYQNGVLKTTTTATTCSVANLSASTAYSFYVVAKDAAGNLSAASNTVNVTTLSPVDTSSPSASTLSATGVTTSSTNLTWTAATDNLGVAGYNLYQNGVLKTTTTATTCIVADLSASTAYSFYVVAKDVAGNLSSASNIVNLTTLSSADTIAPTISTLSASGVTTSSTDLSWTAATDKIGVAGYDLYQNGVLKTTITATTFTVADLSASTAYSFYVVAKDAAGNLSAVSNTENVTTLSSTDTIAPTISTLSASGVTTSSTNLSWTAATDNIGVAGYNVYQNGVLKTTTTATTFTVLDLSASTAYSFYVVAKDAAGNFSAVSNTENVTTLSIADTSAPSASILSASGITTSSTDLSWTAAIDNIGVSGYNVYQNGVLITTTTATTCIVADLSASTAYNFYVVAKDAAGNLSAASNTENVTTLSITDTSAPSASTLSASGVTTSSTNLTWTVATDNIGVAGYNVYQNGVLKTTTTATTYIVADLSASTSYSFYVVAKDAAGNLSTLSNTVNVTTLSIADTWAPSASILSASAVTTSSTNLSWTAATDNIGVSGYNVYQNGVLKTTTTDTTCIVADLSTSTAYSFYVVAKDAAGNLSAISNTENVTTLSPVDTSAPSASTLSASGITISSTNLTWTAATDNIGVAGYNVYQNGVLKTTTTSTIFTVANLSASTAYSFYVVAKDAAGNLSANSNTVNLTTLSSVTTPIATIALVYCSSYGTNTSREFINNVQIGSINNISGNNNGYGNFTGMSTDLAIGSSNTIVITPTWTGTYLYEAFRVWIDFNQDGDFNDSGELAYSKPKSKSKSKSVTGYLNIPTTALIGSTRMRVSMKNNLLPNQCEIFSYGEVEDYTVNITGSTARPENIEVADANITEDKPEGIKRSLIVYPNPVKGDVLHILNLEKPSDFRIFNFIGQELGSNRIKNNALYVGSLKAGLYFIEISDGISTITKQFIKE